ncbi:MAG: biopolymer transporter ExbD [Desulfobacula sp.]|nr:biopolymer transporter ExbD [Desulfobacula sp.]
MKIKLPEERKVRIEMLPLIDIVFLLLVVFIYTMLSMAVHNGLPVSLPSSSTVEPERNLILSVTIKENHDIFVNKHPVLLKDLTNILIQKSEHDSKNGVLVFADNTVSYQILFKILDKIREAGFHEISLQAEAKY